MQVVVPAAYVSGLTSTAVRDPTTWTILQQYGPNHLGLWYNALPEHKNGPSHLGLCALQTGLGLGQSGLLSVGGYVPVTIALKDVYGNGAELVTDQLYAFLDGDASTVYTHVLPGNFEAVNAGRTELDFRFAPLFGCTGLEWRQELEFVNFTAFPKFLAGYTLDPTKNMPEAWVPLALENGRMDLGSRNIAGVRIVVSPGPQLHSLWRTPTEL